MVSISIYKCYTNANATGTGVAPAPYATATGDRFTFPPELQAFVLVIHDDPATELLKNALFTTVKFPGPEVLSINVKGPTAPNPLTIHEFTTVKAVFVTITRLVSGSTTLLLDDIFAHINVVGPPFKFNTVPTNVGTPLFTTVP